MPTGRFNSQVGANGGVKVSRETLRKWIEDKVWLSRRQRRSLHQPRLRRESYGEQIQIDAVIIPGSSDEAQRCLGRCHLTFSQDRFVATW